MYRSREVEKVDMVSGKKGAFRVPFLAVLLLCIPAPLGAQNGVNPRVDYSLARREIRALEVTINAMISSTFSNPFSLVQKTKGVYLQGYGVTFNFLVNIHTALVMTPFGETRANKEISPEEKKRRIEEIKNKLVRVLLDHGDELRQLRKEESVTIVAFIEDRNFPDEESQNKTIVLRAFKRDLDELARREDRWPELKQRMEIIEY